ncbi:hypothetical protein TRP8649_02278 [Pelagimonas phthalicica]|uniref:Uncharacterized protein n=2 Tax=Pelagimonas phthalicica TaxID=1037362 RepID=A0A238JCR3_9RHOB|nr:hypothetical protein CLV87_2280 [Pelagimonas phthalicica]SMX28163.1 hypothetical protein TRP8649_02278 [Pelagimonas phthalicica]
MVGDKQKYAGMTVNERLVVSGFMAVFDKAIERQDYEKASEILEAVELDDVNIEAILAQVLTR